MSATKDGGPAFPVAPYESKCFTQSGTNGMTLRDWFAATLSDGWMKALGEEELICMAPDIAHPLDETASTVEKVRRWLLIKAQLRYMAADAMLAAREGGAK